MYSAVYQGDLAEVQRLLDAGMSADATVAGRTDCPLWVASLRGHEKVVDLLLRQGATLDCPPTEVRELSRRDLPWGVFPSTVDLAADVNYDGRPDAIVRSFCCGADWITVWGMGNDYWPCDYTCGDSWWRGADGWIRCTEWGPC